MSGPAPGVAILLRLEAALQPLLGTYTTAGGQRLPAITLGDPPSDVTATSGLEVVILPDPEFDNARVHQGLGILTETPVQVIPHTGTPPGAALQAVERIIRLYDCTDPVTLPANERLGSGVQYNFRIRS